MYPKALLTLLISGAMLLQAAPPSKPPMKKGDLTTEFNKQANPPKKAEFEKPQKNYDPPKPTGPTNSGPKPSGPK